MRSSRSRKASGILLAANNSKLEVIEMLAGKASNGLSSVLTTVGLVLCSLLITYAPTAQASGPVAQPPYTISVFALSQNGYSKPDSLVRWHQSILVGFGNGVAKDGSDGQSSTIVQYSLSGQLERTFSVKGHNDGLRVQPDSNNLWALQNEDANPNLVIIDLETGQKKVYAFPPAPHGGGYDDILFKDDQVFMTASNPTLNGAGMNVFPALVSVTLSGTMVDTVPVLYGNATATDIPTGTTVTLNLTDPDSLTADPRGNIVLDSQADAELVLITPGGAVGRLIIPSSPPGSLTVDDTAFASSPGAFLLVSDRDGEAVYRIDSPTFGFEPGVAYSASDSSGLVATLNLDTGALTNVVTGLVTGRGMLFVGSHYHWGQEER